MDQNDDGSVSVTEVCSTLEAYGQKFKKLEVADMLREVDDDSELGIDFTQFAQLMSLNTPLTSHLKEAHGKQPVLQALETLLAETKSMAKDTAKARNRNAGEDSDDGEEDLEALHLWRFLWLPHCPSDRHIL